MDGTLMKMRRRLVGVVFLLLLSLLVWLSIAVYGKRFTSAAIVTLRTGSVGNEMHLHADVKLRGVVVGEVRQIAADGSGARLTLGIQPEMVRRLPANVSAQMLPTTLFGQRFVSLVLPAQPVPQRLTDGSVISQDRSSNAIELEQVLDSLQDLLTAVQPEKLSASLNAIAQALEGRGEQLGQTLVEIEAYLREFNRNLPTMNRDIRQLAQVTEDYANATPDILQSLRDFAINSQTIVDQRDNLNALYSTLTGASQDFETFLRENRGTIIRLSADSRSTLQLLARYAPEFPCTLRVLREFIPVVDKALGKGTKEPGLHVNVTVLPAKDRYLPGRDRPVFRAKGGPQCPQIPFRGAGTPLRPGPVKALGTTGTPGTAGTAGFGVAGLGSAGLGSGGVLGPANSPEENQLVNELLGPQLGTTGRSLPDWSSVLVGPVYRGAEVTLR
jgi:phospholipid/cholesterol/gamma-HCH transport system substrate-binding protein